MSRPYSQTQVGDFYQQLTDGARALDIRPLLLLNGTVVFQHDAIRIPVSLEASLSHVIEWCRENPNELVIFLPSHFGYQSSSTAQFASSSSIDDDASSATTNSVSSMISAMARVMDTLGISYYDCGDVYGLTIEEVSEMAAIQNQDGSTAGNLLVLWNSNNGRSCAKENWVGDRVVTCYPKTGVSCTNSQVPLRYLSSYLSESAFSSPTDSTSQLGPPSDRYSTPLHELQALWQVNAGSVVTGLSHGSSLLADNRQSRINAHMVAWFYHQELSGGVLVAVDNVAIHGNALLSVLRTFCGQHQQQSESLCGSSLPLPRLSIHWWERWTRSQWTMEVGSALVTVVVIVAVWKRRRMLLTGMSKLCSWDRGVSDCYHREWDVE